jgi:hypothetical protein
MTITRLAPILSVIILGASSVTMAGDRYPTAENAADVRVSGEALATALDRIGDLYSVRLSAEGELRRQRVSIHAADARLPALCEALRKLLTALEGGEVNWAREAGVWKLRESLARRQLAHRLAGADLAEYRAHLAERLRWAKDEAPKQIAEARSDITRRVLSERAAHSLALASLGDAAIDRLCAGEPLVVPVGGLAAPVRGEIRAGIARRLQLGEAAADELDRWSLVYLLARDPNHARGTHVTVSLVSPKSQPALRHSYFHRPNPRVHPAMRGDLQLPAPPASDRSRRVTVNLAPAADRFGPTTVKRTLDDLLPVVAAGAQVTIVADGYLRAPVGVPRNLTAKDYPLDTLLSTLCAVWSCRWSYLDPGRSTILIRAEMWWMEDAADVPEALVRELRALSNRPGGLDLATLQRLAELDAAQLHKVIETGVCPKARGMILEGWYDEGSSVQPWLRFYNRLPGPLQTRVRSAEGLRLGEAPAALVNRWLGPALVAGGGCLSPESRSKVRVKILAAADGSGFRVSARRGDDSEWGFTIREPR